MQFAYRLAVVASALMCSACVSGVLSESVSRGKLTLATTSPNEAAFKRLASERVAGKACFGTAAYISLDDPIFERAVEDALKNDTDATMLLDVELIDDGSCFEISGIPAKVR